MGNWQLEVGRMVLYMAFPVALFHYFNQPENYEAWVIQKRREVFPKADAEKEEKLKAVIRAIREEKDKKRFAELENAYNKSEKQ